MALVFPDPAGAATASIGPDATESLASLPPGAQGVIVEVELEGPLGARLLDLGFVPDSAVRVLRRAPLGDPVEYQLRGYRICLRDSEARAIRVRRVEAADER